MDNLSTPQRLSTWAKVHHVTCLGKNHEKNEDNYLLEFWPDGSSLLAVVADGMGGNMAGEVAAQIAVDTFRKLLDRTLPADSRERYDLLLETFYAADRAIREQASQSFQFLGMGTTIVAAIITPTEYIHLYAGDCRLYHLRNSKIIHVTADHSIMRLLLDSGQITRDQIASHPMRSVVSSCLGGKGGNSQISIDPKWNDSKPPIYQLETNDFLLLSSDGMHGSVPDETIQELVQQSDNSPEKLAAFLRDTALKNGGQDDLTVVVINLFGEK